MKPVNDIEAYINDFLIQRRFAIGELYTFVLIGGDVARFTNLDFNVTYAGNTYTGNGLIIEGLQFKISTGLSVDEQNVKIMFRPDSVLAGANFIEAVSEGLLDGATVIRQRAMWKSLGGISILDYVGPPQEVITLFTGLVSTVEKIGRTSVELRIASALKILDIEMPRNNYQSGCQWNLFDQGCGLDRADFTVIGEIDSLVGDYGINVVGGVVPSIGADGDSYFAEGRLHFTSGDAQGLTIPLRYNDDNAIYFMYPPITGLAPGDTFEAWPGCSKRLDTCLKKFDNKANHRGFPRVPPIHISA